MASQTSTCPGCGLVLALGDWPLDRRVNASPECWHLCTEVMAHESMHLPELGRYHQLTVDTYAAQHAGPSSSALSTAFALLGLHLALDEGWTGTAVRAAHGYLAGHPSRWPAFPIPPNRGALTVADVAAATTAAAHAQAVQAWATSVWEAWGYAHHQVRSWTDAVLPPEVRGRLQVR